MKLLLIDDEPKIAAFIQKGLTEDGHELTIAYDGKQGYSMALQGEYDAIILDVMLPEMSGLDICRKLREAGIGTPILMLTALGMLDDKVEGLQQGADDYLVKPFHFKELLARLHALNRRQQQQFAVSNVLKFADVQLDCNKKVAQREEKDIILTAKEYALLEMFMQNSNRVLSRAYIAEKVWGYEFDYSSNVIDVYINYLRNKLEKHGARLIHTVIGMGYIMKEQ
jgi:two-component system, OmpR family, copper resistance phosphate regulon response regulator CusR